MCIRMNIKGLFFILKNWRLIVHLLLHTEKFGVNNQMSVSFNSILSTHNKGLSHIRENYKAAKFRAIACGFLTREECKNLGWKSEL